MSLFATLDNEVVVTRKGDKLPDEKMSLFHIRLVKFPKADPLFNKHHFLIVSGDECLRRGKKVKIRESSIKLGKRQTTIVFNGTENGNIKDIKRTLQSVCACGGKCDENTIMLQGWHAEKAMAMLIGLGFDENEIEIMPKPGA